MTVTVKSAGGDLVTRDAPLVIVERGDLTVSLAGGVELELFNDQNESVKTGWLEWEDLRDLLTGKARLVR